MITKPEFATIMAFLFAGLGREPNSHQISAWYECLNDLSAESLGKAAKRWLRENDSGFPSIAAIRGLAGDLGDQDRALLAWQTLRQGLRRIGKYQSVDFDDPLINATVRNLGTWSEISEIKGDDFYIWFRKRFVATYEALCRSGVSEEMAAPLPGIIEIENRSSGYAGLIEGPVAAPSGGPECKLLADRNPKIYIEN